MLKQRNRISIGLRESYPGWAGITPCLVSCQICSNVSVF